MISFDLEGKTAVITGASGGLGRDMARGLLEANANVVILDILEDKARQTAEELQVKTNKSVLAHYVDVSSLDSIEEAVKWVIDKSGKIDILVNNAAIIDYTTAEDLSPEAFNRAININTRGPLFMSQAVFRAYMKEHGGNIVNICSVSGYRSSAVAPTYSISKAATIMLTKCLAQAWGQYGIYCNGIAPGQMLLGMGEDSSPEHIERMSNRVPHRRLGTKDDLNGALVFLSSDACRYTQGQIILCDGGLLLPL